MAAEDRRVISIDPTNTGGQQFPVDVAEEVGRVAWGADGGKPAVVAAGDTASAAQAVIGATAVGSSLFTAPAASDARATLGISTTTPADSRARSNIKRVSPGIARRVYAPGSNLTAFDSLIRVFYDRHKFFTDFDVTTKRHTGTKWYSDRENGTSGASGRDVTLTAALISGTAVTSLAVTAIPTTFPSGSKVVIAAQDSGGNWRSLVATLSAAATAAATSISVTSVVPDFSYPIGSMVANPVLTVFNAYTKAAAGDQLVPLDRKVAHTNGTNICAGIINRNVGWGFGEQASTSRGTLGTALTTGGAITSLALSAALTGTTIAIGDSVTLKSGSGSSAHFQTFQLTSAAAAGATSLTVASQTPNFAFPIGTTVYSGNRITKSITIAPKFPDEVKLVMGDWHGTGGSSVWALKAATTNVYIVTRSGAQQVVDTGIGTYGMVYTLVADATACDAQPGSYYISGSEVGVHYIKDGTPDPKRIHVLMNNTEQTTFRNENGDMSAYLADFTVIGGGANGGVYAQGVVGGNFDFYTRNMKFLYASGDHLTCEAVRMAGLRYTFHQDTKAAFGPKDGFNYHAAGDGVTVLTKAIEVNCESWGHGIGDLTTSSDNASTVHDGIQIVRIGLNLHETNGAPLADVHPGTESWNIEGDAWGSMALDDQSNVSVNAQQAGAVIWLYNVRAFDSNYSINAVSGATVNIFNTEWDIQGPNHGTYNVLTSV